MVIWLIGLSGSGKSTLGREVARQLRARAPNTVLLDGDEIRSVFRHDSDKDAYSIEGRRVNAERITALCELLDKQGIHVVCCILSIFPQMRLTNRKRFSQYFEIFMDAPIETLIGRDVKGIYKKALDGSMKNVVGVDIPFEPPTDADMRIDSSGESADIVGLATEVMQRVKLN